MTESCVYSREQSVLSHLYTLEYDIFHVLGLFIGLLSLVLREPQFHDLVESTLYLVSIEVEFAPLHPLKLVIESHHPL